MKEEGDGPVSASRAAKVAASSPRYSTGAGSLDELIGGGLRAGRLVEVYGSSGCGKTQLAMQAALCAAHVGTRALYVDTEGGFRPERIEEIADARSWDAEVLLRRIEYVRCDTSAEQTEVVRGIDSRDTTSGCRLVVIDTLTRNFTLDMPGRSNLASRQGALDVHLSEIARDAVLGSRAYLLTNRVTFGQGEDVGIGGRTVDQLVHSAYRMSRDGSRVRVSTKGGGPGATLDLGRSGLL